MGWRCVQTSDTNQPKYPHIETIDLWFIANPNYREIASGPSLCADLKSSGQPQVTVTFDTWGNRFTGLHGYDTIEMSSGKRQLKIYGTESGGFHDDTPHYGNFDSVQDKKIHPEKYRFPIDTFR
jgi:hypothetical protein